jgi:hypothetical protein
MIDPQAIPQLYALLTSPVTAFDCGVLCAPRNGGVPVCCHAQTVVPVLYRAELEWLRKRTRLWRRYVPTDARERAMAREVSACDVLAVCRGAAFCEREHRSIACRTFPFEPYVDHRSRLAGMVYNYEFTGLCPLIDNPAPILTRFIDQCIALWASIFELDQDELQFYSGTSQTLRRSFGQKRLPIPVFTQAGVRQMPTMQRRPARRPRPSDGLVQGVA